MVDLREDEAGHPALIGESRCSRSFSHPDVILTSVPSFHALSPTLDLRITTDCTEYYLYPLELALLEEHASSIVDHLFPSKDEREGEQARHHHLRRPPVSHWRIGEWGDSSVGKYNGGVNSEEGLDGSSVGRSHDASSPSKQQQQLDGIVLELGAGSLGKTRSVYLEQAQRQPKELTD